MGRISSHFAATPQNFTFPSGNISHFAVRQNISLKSKVLRHVQIQAPRFIGRFSVNAVKPCEKIKGHYSLVNQLERSATCIGAIIHEANYARGFFNEVPLRG